MKTTMYTTAQPLAEGAEPKSAEPKSVELKSTELKSTELKSAETNALILPTAALPAGPSPDSPIPGETIRHILLGSPGAIRQTIYLLHTLRYSETVLWSPVLRVEEPLVITPEQGEAVSLLRRMV